MSKKKIKSLVPKLRFNEFKNSEKWEEKTIDQIADGRVTAGGTPSTTNPEFWNGDIRWMNSGELNLKRIFEVKGRITEIGLNNSSTKIIPQYSVLIGLAGQGKTRGTVAMNMVELCINQSIAAIFPNMTVFNSDFLYHYLDGRYDELRSLSTGEGGRGGLNLQIIKGIKVHLPELLIEQEKVADCLTCLDELITAESEKLEAYKKHKKGLMQKLFPVEGKTVPEWRFPEFRDSNVWKKKNFNDLFDIGNGRDYKHLSKGDIPVYGSGGYMLSVDKFLYEGESVCIGRKGTIDNPIFLTGRFWTVDTLFYTYSFKDCLPKYIYYVFQNINWLKHNEASGVPSLSKTNIYKIKTLIPLPEEQLKIADCLSSFDDLITSQKHKIEILRVHKKGLIQGLFPSADEVGA